MEGKQVSLPEFIITCEIHVDLEKRVHSFKGTWSMADGDWMAIEVGVFHDQVASGRDQWAVKFEFPQDMVALVVGTKDDEGREAVAISDDAFERFGRDRVAFQQAYARV
jgi:hypothetical protein